MAMVMSRGGRFDTVDESWKDDHIKAAYKFPVQIWHEGLAKMRHSMTGERYAGCPTWFPTRFADGSSMREHYPESGWPLTMSSYKSNLMSSMSIGVKRLRQVHPHNPISLHSPDGQGLCSTHQVCNGGPSAPIFSPCGRGGQLMQYIFQRAEQI